MAKSDDITIFMTSDGLEWGKFLADQLDAFKGKVTYKTLQLDDMEYENPTEVTQACTTSLVVLLLASPDTLNYMQEKAGWFSLTMQKVPGSSAVVVVTLMDKENVDRCTANTYDTSGWRHMDPGQTHEDVQQMVAGILDIVDRCRHSKHVETAEPTESSKKRTPSRSKQGVKLFPSTVYEPNELVALVFTEGVDGEVVVKIGKSEKPVVTSRLNSCVFTFCAPEMSQGKHHLTVTAGGRTQRTHLSYLVLETVFSSTHYLRQCLGVTDDHELDLRLKDIFVSSLPGDNVLDAIFEGVPDSESTDSQKNANCKYPTLLHFAAANGLAEFCSALVECAGSSRAYNIRNCDGLDPADLAFHNDFDDLGNYIIDFMTMQHAEDLYAHYVTLHQSEVSYPGDDLYEDMSRYARSLTSPPISPLRSAPLPPPPTSPRPPPQLPPRAQSMDNVLKRVHVDDLKAAGNPRRNPPPVPPDAAAFMGMTARQGGAALPQGAVGSRTQSELIEIHELFKSGEISINEAQMLFNSWQQRCGRNTAVSFKDRQKELEKIRSEYLKKRNDSGRDQRDIFSWMRRGKNKESIRPTISEPVVPRQSPKSMVYCKPRIEPPTQDRSSTASTGSSSSSRDSGWSVGSRDSTLSASVEKSDSEDQEDELSSSAHVTRRPRTSTSSLTNRQSLGGQFLEHMQQTDKQTDSEPVPPPRPPPRRK